MGVCPSGQRERAVNPSACAYNGSNPFAPTPLYLFCEMYAGIAQLVEHRPSKPRVASSSLVSRSSAHVAQLVEHTLGKGEVTGSSPVMGSTQKIYEKANYFMLIYANGSLAKKIIAKNNVANITFRDQKIEFLSTSTE